MTTLARTFVGPGDTRYLDLEDPTVETQIEQPMSLLEPMRGLVVIDEVERAPDLLGVAALARVDDVEPIQSQVDRRTRRGRTAGCLDRCMIPP